MKQAKLPPIIAEVTIFPNSFCFDGQSVLKTAS